MSDTTPSDTPATAPKTILRSLTFWVQVITFLAALFPAVQKFIVENPETTVAVLGAINVLVRFATKGKVTLFGENTTPPAGSLMAFLVAGTMAGLMGIVLPSCSSPTGKVTYRTAEGLEISYRVPLRRLDGQGAKVAKGREGRVSTTDDTDEEDFPVTRPAAVERSSGK